MKNNIRTLVIDEGSEFKIKVEKLEEFNKSFFRDIYDSAAVNVKEIIENTKEYHEGKEFSKDKEEANNIIAFTGERGTGKSSVMISFAEALKTIENDRIVLDKDGYEKFRSLKDVSFVNLDIIDPALLENKESIFEIVIAKMFSAFKEHLEKGDEKLEFDDKKILLKKFQKVYKDLKVINTDRKEFFKDSAYSEDILQTLVNLASGSNMRKSFIELVNGYLDFFIKDKKKDERFLVIPIDDLDMNIRHSAEMAEQIRKYLMVPNVIILMAVKIDQLKDSIEQMYRKNYEVMLRGGNLSDDPKEMAERYIEKLIPNGRKLYLAEIRAVRYGKKEKISFTFKSKDNAEMKCDEFENIEEAVLGMTYRKTGLIFIKPTYSMNYLVPDNLRELQNYLIMLNKMEDVNLNLKGQDNNDDIRMKNIEKFETYFLNTWIKRSLDRVYINLIKEFYNTNLSGMNKFIVTEIKKIILNQMNEDSKNQMNKDSKKEIFEVDNNSVNVSIGDVLNVFTIYRDYDSSQIKKFKFAIKTIYSIIISKLLYTEDNSISILIGGNIYSKSDVNNNILDLINYPGLEMKSKVSASDMVQEIVDKILDKIQKPEINMNEDGECKLKIKEEEESELRINIKLLERINYFIYIRAMDEKPNYRVQDEAYYDRISNLGCGQIEFKTAKFDMLAFVFFLINPMKNLEKIFLGRIKSVLDKKDYFESDGNRITEKKVLNEIKKFSLFDEIEVWKKQYKVVLPIHSVDILENIDANIEKIMEKKFKKGNIPYYNNIFKRMFTAVLPEIINDIKEDNKFLLHENEEGNKVCLFEEAYNRCPIIDLVRGPYYNKENKENKEISDDNLFEITINNAYVISDKAIRNLSKKNQESVEALKIILEVLNRNKNNFIKWSEKIVSAFRINREIKEIISYGKVLSPDTFNQFIQLRGRLDEIRKDVSKDLELTRIEIVEISLEILDKEIDRIQHRESRLTKRIDS